MYEKGHWILQAKACIDKDRLDTYAYRRSILLTRELMDQHRALKEKRRSDEMDIDGRKSHGSSASKKRGGMPDNTASTDKVKVVQDSGSPNAVQKRRRTNREP